MLRFTIRRLLLTVPVLLGVATLVFSLMHLVPGDPAQAMLGESASASDVDELRARLGLDRSLPAQYVQFVSGLARGDLGTSFRYNTPVASEIGQRLPRTMQLAGAAVVVAVCLAIPLGVLGGVLSRHGHRSGGDDGVARRNLDAELLARPAAGDLVFRVDWDGCPCRAPGRGGTWCCRP